MAFGVAVIGLDHWYTAFGFIDNAKDSDAVRLVGIAEADAGRRDEMRAKHEGVPVTDDPAALIGQDDVDLVAITTSTDQAPGLAKRALAAGKHVLSVKPPARTLAELDEVIAAAERAGRFYGSFEGMQRLTPRVRRMRELVQGGAIGVPLTLYQMGHGGLPQPWPGQKGPSWWIDADKVPGGAWIDHAIYPVDLARFVFAGEVDRATGIIENRVRKELRVEDYGVCLMRLVPTAGGPSVSLILEDTWAAEEGGGAYGQRLYGSAGMLHADGNDLVITKGREETRHPIPESPFFNIDALAGMLQTGQAPTFGPADARANLAACLAVYEDASSSSAGG